MQERIKQLFFTGIGLVSLTTENLQKAINQLIEDRKISLEEGKKVFDEFIKNTESKRGEFETQMNKIVERIAKNFNFSPSKEVEELKTRIAELEEQVEALQKLEEKNKLG